MATLETVYLGNLRTEITHVRSGNKVITDAPVDNNGRGEAISPTDMVAGALGSCMLTIMAQATARLGTQLEGTRLEITKIMAAEPRRISEIVIDVWFPMDYDDKAKQVLRHAANVCPVAKSLHPDLKQTITFHFGQP